MKHPENVTVTVNPAALASEVVKLRYDRLALFLAVLHDGLIVDSQEDEKGGRPKLSENLNAAADAIKVAHDAIQNAWRICERNTDGG